MEELTKELKEAILPNCSLLNKERVIDKFAEKLSYTDLYILTRLVTSKMSPIPSKCLFLTFSGKDKRLRINQRTYHPVRYSIEMWRCATLKRVQALMHIGEDSNEDHDVCINPYHYESTDPLEVELGPLQPYTVLKSISEPDTEHYESTDTLEIKLERLPSDSDVEFISEPNQFGQYGSTDTLEIKLELMQSDTVSESISEPDQFADHESRDSFEVELRPLQPDTALKSISEPDQIADYESTDPFEVELGPLQPDTVLESISVPEQFTHYESRDPFEVELGPLQPNTALESISESDQFADVYTDVQWLYEEDEKVAPEHNYSLNVNSMPPE